jgi:hypothetical protein
LSRLARINEDAAFGTSSNDRKAKRRDHLAPFLY